MRHLLEICNNRLLTPTSYVDFKTGRIMWALSKRIRRKKEKETQICL